MGEERNIIKLRGLPWNSSSKDVLEFLKDCQVLDGEKGVHLAISHRDGRPNGEAFVEMATLVDVDKAFEYNKQILGHRYIEIFNAKPEEFEQCLKRQNLVQQDTFIKLRGLPFSCKPEDVVQFFQGLEIRNGTNGIYIVSDSRGRPTGEAFVQFCNSEDTDLAMKRNREKIGSRYIEIFRSSSSECRRSTIFNNGRNNVSSVGGFNNNNNDRMGRGQRNNRTNFRDRPYPETSWTPSNNNNGNNNNNNNNDGGGGGAPWRNNNRSNSNMNNFGGGGNNNFSDNFDSGSMFNTDSNFSSDFERNWNTGGGNSFNSFGGAGNSNNNKNNNSSSFDRDNFGFNNFNSNSNNSGNSNFGNDRFMGNNNGSINNRGGGGGGGSCDGGQYAVHLRGMPYDCGESEVLQFFAPLKVVNCQVFYNNNGRHTGEADAYFETVSDAQEAMKKHKERMGNRYIELFAKSNERRGGGRF